MEFSCHAAIGNPYWSTFDQNWSQRSGVYVRHRKLSTAAAPASFHRIPEPHKRCFTITLHAASVTPEPMGSFTATRDVAQAARAGRQQMFEQKDRVCAAGRKPLDDWLVPVVYQQEPFDFSFAKKAKKVKADGGPELPGEARDTENPYGFIGRDGAVLALERAMHRPPAGLLIQGLGGVGKTTLARGFLQWLQATDGLGNGGFWFAFQDQDVRSAESVINELGDAVFGSCEPTTHRSCFTDSASFSFCRLGPPAHRSDWWRRQMLFATFGRSFAPVPPLPVSARQCR